MSAGQSSVMIYGTLLYRIGSTVPVIDPSQLKIVIDLEGNDMRINEAPPLASIASQLHYIVKLGHNGLFK